MLRLRSLSVCGERNKLGRSVEGIEHENAVLLGEAKVFCDLGRKRGAVGLFLEQFGVDGGRSAFILTIFCLIRRVLLLPAAGGVEIDEGKRNLLLRAVAFRADVTDQLADDAVTHHDLIAAIFEKETGAMGRIGGVGGLERFLWRLSRATGHHDKDGQSGGD